MDMKRIFSAATLLLAGLLFAGCQKETAQKKTPTQAPAAGVTGIKVETNTVSRDLGALTLTNHYETCVQLSPGKDCILTPKIIDSHNMQLTLAVESKTAAGKIHDLSVTQVVAHTGQPLEVAVGNYSLSLTPNIATE